MDGTQTSAFSGSQLSPWRPSSQCHEAQLTVGDPWISDTEISGTNLEQNQNSIYWIYCLFEAKIYVLIHFDPFWSILNMAGAASPQRQPLERLLDRRMQSVWLPCYCGNMWKQRQAVSDPFWSILPFCHETVPGLHFCLLSCQCGFHWPNSQRNTALAWVSCCFLNIDKQNQTSRNMQKLMNHFKFILIICDIFFRSFRISWTLRLSTWPEMMPEAILFPACNTALDVPLSIALCKYTYFILLF